MTKLIGWIFVLISPIMCAPLIIAFLLYIKFIPTDMVGTIFVIYTIIWSILFVSWFDGSKYQDLL